MKKILVLLLSFVLLFSLFGCETKENNNTNAERPYTGAPKIVLDGHNYFTTELCIVNEVPEGYSYAGELTDQEKEYAQIDGSKYYTPNNDGVLEDFFVYQECGTLVSENEVDNTKRQWAYVKWSLGD